MKISDLKPGQVFKAVDDRVMSKNGPYLLLDRLYRGYGMADYNAVDLITGRVWAVGDHEVVLVKMTLGTEDVCNNKPEDQYELEMEDVDMADEDMNEDELVVHFGDEEEPEIEVVTQDLFTVPQGYYLAHCISADYALGAGIAKQFDEVYNMKYKLHKNFPIYSGLKYEPEYVGLAHKIDNVFNLITKARCYDKPTYDDLTSALKSMKEQCKVWDITKLAMPMIGCGLDRLQWSKVEEIIKEVFADTGIKILICKL